MQFRHWSVDWRLEFLALGSRWQGVWDTPVSFAATEQILTHIWKSWKGEASLMV
jgi:hypothetical protein